MTLRILIVDDDPDALELYAVILKQAGYEVIQAVSGRDAEWALRTSQIDVLVTDLKMPVMGGLDVVRIAREIDPEIIVILVTAFPDVESAVGGLKLGASDYLIKPFSPEQLILTIHTLLEKSRAREGYGFLKSQVRRSIFSGIVGRAQVTLKLFTDIQRTASVDASVLILGESGVGKELVAKAVHENSARQNRSFVPINCAAIPENLLEAELFGYEKGAFTGAHSARKGLLELTDSGTLFLDELCELSPTLQAKLLRVLEEGVVRRLGGREPTSFDIRFMASTNRDIQDEMKQKRFREDLYFRINVIEIRVPPLRERREDIPLLATHFLEVCSAHYARNIEGMNREAMDVLTSYDWPGNVRELKNAIERAFAYAQEPLIMQDDLPEAVKTGFQATRRYDFHQWKEKTLERLEKEFLENVLNDSGGNVTQAARALGIHRSTLQRLMRKHHLSAA
jgi:DNA-binding NtrC family response regulator